MTNDQQPATSIQQQVFSNKYPVSSIQHPVSSTQYPASSIQHPVSSIQYPVSSIQYPASMTSDYSHDLKSFLDEKVLKYNQPFFIETDPIQVLKIFSEKENIEIAAFLTATIAWGNRLSIIKNATKLMDLMDYQPYDFIIHSSNSELKNLERFVHRTFNGNDCVYFIRSLKNIYQNHDGLQAVFEAGFKNENSVKSALTGFHKLFFEIGGERSRKHVSNVEKGASAKRLNMFLRWMVRRDKSNVDFGLWNGIPQSELMLPLDVHTGNVARKLGLLQRKSNDWQAVDEVTQKLREFDPEDPIKYDFALFGLGVFEKF